jgi:hypothetical protein
LPKIVTVCWLEAVPQIGEYKPSSVLASETELRTGCESLKLEVVTYCRYKCSLAYFSSPLLLSAAGPQVAVKV